MRPLIYLLLFVTIFMTIDCGRKARNPQSADLSGEWILDSISGTFSDWDKDFIYITPKSQFWRLTYWNDQYLVDSCLMLQGTEVRAKNSLVYHIQLRDTAHLTLTDHKGNSFHYRKSEDSDANYLQNLINFLKDDSLKQALAGTWKLQSATLLPLKLLNTPKISYQFSLVLQPNRKAFFILEDNGDSVIHYSWNVWNNQLGLSKGDMGLSSPIYYLDDQQMKLSLTSRMTDTFTLKRVNY